MMSRDPHRAIMVIGRELPTGAIFDRAGQYDEVFVTARACPDPHERFVIDEDRAYAAARERLDFALGRLRQSGVRALGTVGDENAGAARDDALALFPAAEAILG